MGNFGNANENGRVSVEGATVKQLGELARGLFRSKGNLGDLFQQLPKNLIQEMIQNPSHGCNQLIEQSVISAVRLYVLHQMEQVGDYSLITWQEYLKEGRRGFYGWKIATAAQLQNFAQRFPEVLIMLQRPVIAPPDAGGFVCRAVLTAKGSEIVFSAPGPLSNNLLQSELVLFSRSLQRGSCPPLLGGFMHLLQANPPVPRKKGLLPELPPFMMVDSPL